MGEMCEPRLFQKLATAAWTNFELENFDERGVKNSRVTALNYMTIYGVDIDRDENFNNGVHEKDAVKVDSV